ncbi:MULTISPECIES: RNA polymerase sigma factor [Niastella]|uniref:RNA polymerase sigma-70 factor n=1 Tax=Niastella soli TaxID=2821487 RepID=A0ABS3Z1D4_9BACT|nr:RNA polymerase sigma-70 factor [Niastella soli]MBO9203976.1 RNA polymerase sigma-70 factor [Niastella soli]
MRSVQSENDIIDTLKNGGPEALQTLLKQFYSPLCLFAERLLTDRAAAEDIVGESFIKLWNKRSDFETTQNIKAFMYITVRNACLNHLKQAKRDSLSKKQLAYLMGEKEEFVLNEMIRAEVLKEIMQEINNLPEQCRKVLKMGYLEGLRNQEIANLLNISIHTVRNQKVRAIQLLKIRLRDRDVLALLLLCGFLKVTTESCQNLNITA